MKNYMSLWSFYVPNSFTSARLVPSFGLKVSFRCRTLLSSKANITSKWRKSSSFTFLARWLLAIPCFFNTCNPRSFDWSPSRKTWVPALSIFHSFLSLHSCVRCLKIALAVGERQVRKTWVPALSIFHSFLSLRSCVRCLKIALAVGERQVLPRQTNTICRYLESAILDSNKANKW